METEEIAKLADRCLLKIVQRMRDQARAESTWARPADLSDAVFLLHYGQYFADQDADSLAGELLEEIYPKTNNAGDQEWRYGIAGTGCCIEYLFKQCLVTADTDDILGDVDLVLGEISLSSSLKNTDLQSGALALGRYFLSRLQNPLSKSRASSLNALQNVLDLLNSPYHTYDDIAGVISFLSVCISENVVPNKAHRYLCYALDKLETMLHEDIHFKKIASNFRSHRLVLMLHHLSGVYTGDSFLARINIVRELLIKSYPARVGGNKELLLFMVNSAVFQLYYPPEFIAHQHNRLVKLLKDQDDLINALSVEKDEHQMFFNPFSAAGMCLLYFSGKIGKEWQERFNEY